MNKELNINLKFENVDQDFIELFDQKEVSIQLVATLRISQTDENRDNHLMELKFDDRELLKENLIDLLDKFIYDKPSIKDLIDNPKHISNNLTFLTDLISGYTLDPVDDYDKSDILYHYNAGLFKENYKVLDLGLGVYWETRLIEMIKECLAIDHIKEYYSKTKLIPIVLRYEIQDDERARIDIKLLK